MARNYAKLKWQKGFRTLPAAIRAVLAQMKGDEKCIVSCAKHVTVAELEAGDYRHLYIDSADDFPEDFDQFIPSPNVGPASYRNATLIEKADHTKGKRSKAFHGIAPNNNWGGGYHSTVYHRDVWHTTIRPPKMSYLAFKRIGQTDPTGGVTVKFQIQEVIDLASPDHEAELLHCINLLQENTGKIGLFAITAPEEAYMRNATEDIGWEVVPDHRQEDTWNGLARKLGKRSPQLQRKAQDRWDFILSLNPRKVMHGTRGFVGYFAAEFTDSLTIFEHLEIDHAMYLIHGDATSLSQLTRSQLTARLEQGVEKIVHSKNWQDRVREKVRKARGDPKPGDLL